MSESVGEGARTGMALVVLAVLGCFERVLAGGLCGDEGGFEILPVPSDELGDGERSRAAEDASGRDEVPIAADELLAAPALAGFLRGISSSRHYVRSPPGMIDAT